MRILQSKAISRIGARAGLAFSRNGPKKVYIQYKMLEDSEALADACTMTIGFLLMWSHMASS